MIYQGLSSPCLAGDGIPGTEQSPLDMGYDISGTEQPIAMSRAGNGMSGAQQPMSGTGYGIYWTE